MSFTSPPPIPFNKKIKKNAPPAINMPIAPLANPFGPAITRRTISAAASAVRVSRFEIRLLRTSVIAPESATATAQATK
jgi:hypothetical protein